MSATIQTAKPQAAKADASTKPPTMTERVFNFSPGPAVLPVPVLEQVQREMLSLPGVGMSILEISHRSKAFDAILAEATQGIRDLLGVPDGYHILFMQGGASLQFYMLARELASRQRESGRLHPDRHLGKKGDRRSGSRGGSPRRVGRQGDQLQSPAEVGRVETESRGGLRSLHGKRNHSRRRIFKPSPTLGKVPLVCDASSNFLSRPIADRKVTD